MREGRYFLHTHSHSAKSWDQPTVVDFMNRFSDLFQTVTDRDLLGVNTPTRWLTNSGCIAQALGTLNYHQGTGQLVAPGNPGISVYSETHLPHCVPNGYGSNVPAITVGPVCRRGEGPAATSPTSAEAGYSCGGSGRRTSGGVGSGGRCQGRTIGPT